MEESYDTVGSEMEVEDYDTVGSVRQTAEFPKFAIESVRLRSFSNWPKQMKQKPEQLADAGLFYTQHGDNVVCFSCGGGLREWDEDDIPWEQHALYYEDCKYMKLLKGNGYHDEVITKLATARIAKQNNQASEDLSSLAEPSPCATTTESTVPTTTDDDAKCCSKFDEKLSEYKKCKICYDNDYNAVLLPCAHMIACVKCASALAVCPTCNGTIENIIKVYLP